MPFSPVRVRVPASTSNLGPGFDCLGLALSIFLEVTVEGPAAGDRHERVLDQGPAREDWLEIGDDLLLRAFDLAVSELGGRRKALRFRIASQIPIGRGLGSSAAAIAAGLLLGAHVAPPRDVSRETLLGWGLRLEGHPDNLAPALLGGFRLALADAGPNGAPLALRQTLDPSLGFAVAWPSARVMTQHAREVLPSAVPLGDAVHNAGRLALLLAGLRSGDREQIAAGLEDRLHVPFRMSLIPGGEQAVGAARGAGAWGVTVSGSGSALLAIAEREQAQRVAEEMAHAFRRADGNGEGHVVEPVHEAPRPFDLGPEDLDAAAQASA